VLVLSRGEAIRFPHAVMVAPITSTIRGLPSQVVIGPAEGLRAPSAVKLDQVQTVEKARLRRYVGRLGPVRMREACRALAVATGCDAASSP
jgi:mRNA interferase MazF